MDVDSAYKTINEEFTPRTHQRECWKLLDEDYPGIVLLSGTGSGKTESILIPSLLKNKRLIMIYPTRSLVNDQINRTRDYIRKIIARGKSKIKTIIVDLGDEQYSLRYSLLDTSTLIPKIKARLKFWMDIGKLEEIELRFDDTKEIIEKSSFDTLETKIGDIISKLDGFDLVLHAAPYSIIEIEKNKHTANFFVEKSKKHYYGGDVILTTIDKFLYRFFGYGEKQWNLVYPYRLFMGEESKKRLVVCFDEAHTYDGVSYTNFINLLSTLIAGGINTIVMSATLPEEFIELAQTKFGMQFVQGGDYKGKKTYEILGVDDADRTKKMREFIDENLNKKTIVVRNTIRNAFELYNLLSKESKNGTYKGVPLFFYHGRLFSFWKSKVYNALKELDQMRKPYILITTHAIEVGCDLNSELLITDFCNPDQLIQRAGRCARTKDSEGKLIIVGKNFIEDSPSSDLFLKEEESFDYERYLQILNEQNKSELPEEEIRKVIRHNLRKEELSDALFHFLYSYIYEFDRTREELHSSGIIATRSWTPSANLFWVKKEFDLRKIRELCENMSILDVISKLRGDKIIYNYEPISISLDLLGTESVRAVDIKDKFLVIAVEDSASQRYVYGNINPYLNDIYVFCKLIEFPNINPLDGLIEVPKIFEKRDRGVITTLSVNKQILLDPNRYMRVEFLKLGG